MGILWEKMVIKKIFLSMDRISVIYIDLLFRNYLNLGLKIKLIKYTV